MPFFSIIIPTYNRARLLNIAIESVVSQKYKDWELLVIDDGSDDETYSVVERWNDERIQYYYQDNQGKSAARNAGADRAVGEFLCFLDSDDYFLDCHLQDLKDKIDEKGVEFAVYGTGLIMSNDKHGNGGKTNFYYPEKGLHPIAFFLLMYKGGNILNPLAFPRLVFNDHRFDVRWYYFQDSHFVLRVLSEIPFYQIYKHTCVCRVHFERSSYTLFKSPRAEEWTENNVGAIENLFEEYRLSIQPHVPIWMRDFLLCSKYMDHSTAYQAAGNLRLSWKFFLKAVQYDKKGWGIVRYLRFLPKIPLKILFDYPKLPDNKD